MMKLLIGGSPCTHWSIAQTKNRETTAEGIGWELFKNYLIAREKYKPDYFLYENNKSMASAIREQITKELGVEPVLINSALVSAQNRQRLYWVGKRELDGRYSQVHIEQPEDRGILLRDILETGHPLREKAYALLSTAHGATAEDAIARRQRNAAAEPVQVKPLSEREMEYMLRETKDGRNHFDFDYHHDASRDKSSCVTANTYRGVPYNVLVEPVEGEPAAMRQVGRRINEQGHRDDYNEAIPHFQYFEVNDNPQKTNCLSTVEKDNMVAVPVRVGDMPNAEGVIRGGQAHRIYDSGGKAVTLTARPNGGGVDGPLYATPVMAEHMVDAEKNQTVSRSIDEIVEKKGYLPEMFNPYNRAEIKEKSPTLSTGSMVTSSCATLVVEELEQPDAPVRIGTIENAAKNPGHDSQQYRVYSPDGKAVTLCGAGGGIGAKTGLYAVPVSFAHASAGGDQTGICRNPARRMCGPVHAEQQDKEGTSDEG